MKGDKNSLQSKPVCLCARTCASMHVEEEVAVSGAREAAALFELQTSEESKEWAFVSRRHCVSKYFGSGHAVPRDCSLRPRGGGEGMWKWGLVGVGRLRCYRETSCGGAAD